MSYVAEPDMFVRYDDAEDICLRDYQGDSIEQLRGNIRIARKTNAGHLAQVLSCATGAGKTICAAFLLRECWQNGKNGLFVVDRTSLLDQTSAVFKRFGIPHGVLGGNHPRYMPGELIQVASIQTIAKRGWPKAELIIPDECHILHKTMLTKIGRRDAEIIGLTATPFARGMGKFYSHLVTVTTTNKLIKEGVLCPYKIWASAEPDMTGAKVVAGEWTDEEAEKRATKIIGDVVKEYREKVNGGKAICFGVTVSHCEELQRQFLAAGVNAALYTYKTPDEEREMLIGERGEFRKSDSAVRVLISVAALSRGFDVPDLSAILMCRPLKSSFMEFLQVIGRGLRAHPLKTHVKLLDLAGNFMRHYPAMMEFFEDGALALDDGKPKPKAQKSIPAEKKPKKCPKCACVFGAGSFCPSCGHPFVTRSTIQHEVGSLSEFDGKKAVQMDRASKLKLFSELRYICRVKGYKPGWSAHTYQRITGTMPGGFGGCTPLPPSAATLRAVQLLNEKHRRKMRQKKPAQHKPTPVPVELDLFA